MKIYYRISDKSYPKIKLPGATKRSCLKNLIETLRPMEHELCIIADNCGEGTLEWLRSLKYEVHETNLGNAGALFYSMTRARMTNPHVNSLAPVYFVEDDYLHDPKRAAALFEEGRWCAGDGRPFGHSTRHYWTLFDHPDKYSKMYNYHEVGKVTRTKSGHWKQSISTTMTFATTFTTLELDFPVWEKLLKKSINENHNHPNDHGIFQTLAEGGSELFVSIPGAAFHTDLTPYGLLVDQQPDQFAIDLAFDRLYAETSFDPLVKAMVDQFLGSQTPEKTLFNLARIASIWETLQSQ